MLPVICKVNNEMAQGLKEYYGFLLCPLTHYVLFMVSVVLPTELFVELCNVTSRSSIECDNCVSIDCAEFKYYPQPKRMKSQPVKHFIHLVLHNKIHTFFQHNAGCV